MALPPHSHDQKDQSDATARSPGSRPPHEIGESLAAQLRLHRSVIAHLHQRRRRLLAEQLAHEGDRDRSDRYVARPHRPWLAAATGSACFLLTLLAARSCA